MVFAGVLILHKMFGFEKSGWPLQSDASPQKGGPRNETRKGFIAATAQELLDRELVLRHPQPPVLPSNKSWQHLGREKRAHSCLSTHS